MRRERTVDSFGVKRLADLVGRDEELGRLRELLDEAVRGNGGTVFVQGEAGIGKSRLIAELRDEAEAKGARTLVGRGLEGASPYMPFINALRDVGPDLITPGDLSIIEEVFLLNEKGLLMAHAARTLRTDVDERTFGRVFATIKDFMSRSFEGRSCDATLDELQYGSFKILFETEHPFYLAVVVSGEVSSDLKVEMSRLVAELSREFGDWARDWSPEKTVPARLERDLSRFASMEFRTERRLEGLDPKRERDRMFDSVLGLILAISRVRPVVMALDDMQWLDDSSLDLLHYIARNIRDARVLLVGAYRPEEGLMLETDRAQRLTETLRRMNREKLYVSIKLRRLDREETRAMVDSILVNNDFPADFHDKVFKETEGNPFFVEEIIESLEADGAIRKGVDGIWRVRPDMVVSLPTTIKDVVLRRMDRLDEEYRRILETAAILGAEFNIDILMEVLQADEEELIIALDELAGMRLLKELPGGEFYTFDHGVIQEVIYEEMSRNLRRMMHKKVAEVLEERFKTDPDSVVYDLARHWARTRDDRKAFDFSVKAANRAARLHALKEAIAYFDQSMYHLGRLKDMQDREKVHIDLLLQAARAAYHAGDWDKATEYTAGVLEKAPAHEKYKEMATAYRLRGQMAGNRSRWEDAILDLQASVEISEGIDDRRGRLEAFHMLGKIYWRQGDYDKSLEYLNECIRGAEKDGDDHLLAEVLISKGNVYNVKGDIEESIKLYERGLAKAQSSGNAFEVIRAYNNLGDLYMDINDLDTAEEYFKKCKDTADRIGDRRFMAYALINIGETAIKRGDLDKARTNCTQALDIFTKLDEKVMVAATYIDFGVMHCIEKNWAESSVCFEIAIHALEELGHPLMLAEAHHKYGVMFKDKGDRVSALTHLETALEVYRKSGAPALVNDVERELSRIRTGEELSRVELVGRDEVVQVLWDRLLSGTGMGRSKDEEPGAVALLAGEQGLGKSRVMDEILGRARAKEVTTIVGHCLRSEMGNPFYPLVQALTELLRGKDPDSLKRFLKKVPMDILAMLPGIETLGEGGGAGRPPSQPPEGGPSWSEEGVDDNGPANLGAMKDRMFGTLSRLLLEADEPMALFIEDMHYADVSSLQLITYMAGEISGSRTFILATYSPDAVVPDNGFEGILRELEGEGTVSSVTLGPLDREATSALIARLLGIPAAPDDLVDKVFKRTKGNPMFLEELLKSVPRGIGTDDLAKMDLDRLQVPGNIMEVILEQTARLAADGREMLEYSSVAGFSFPPGLLFEAMGIGEEAASTKEAAGILKDLVERRYLREDSPERLSFYHPMVQQVIYERIDPKKRRKMHRAFARSIERKAGARVDEMSFDLAYHFFRAGPSDKAFRYNILAGHRAEGMSAPREAERFFRDAVRSAEAMRSRLGSETTVSAGEVLSARHHLSQALSAQGRLDEAQEVARVMLSMARDVGDAAREAQALMDIAEIVSIKSSWDEARSALDRARALCAEIGFQRGLFRAHKGLSWISWRTGEFENAFTHAHECIGIGEALDDKHLIAQGYTEMGSAFGERGDFELAIENLSRARAIFEAAGDKHNLSRVLNNLGVSYRDKGDPEGAITHFERSAEIARETGGVRMEAYALSNLSECQLMIGQLDKAERTCDRSLSMFLRLDEPYMVSSCYRRLGMIDRRRGEYGAAEGHFMKSIAIMKDMETPLHTAETLYELGLLKTDTGDHDGAQKDLDDARAIFDEVGSKHGTDRVGRALSRLDEARQRRQG